MAKWTVEGADGKTGVDVVVSVEALTEDEARADAAKMGLLVSSVHRSVADDDSLPENAQPAIEYAGRSTPPPQVLVRPHSDYPDIVRGEKWLSIVAVFVSALGGVQVIFGLLALIFAIIVALTRSLADKLEAVQVVLGPATMMVISGLLFIAIAAVLRMIGAVAMAVRDATLNTYLIERHLRQRAA